MNAARRLFRALVSLLTIASLSLWTASVAIATDEAQPRSFQDIMPVKTVRPSYEYERCFDACQQALDKALAVCASYIEAENAERRGSCRRSALERFEQALAQCPADTGRRDAR